MQKAITDFLKKYYPFFAAIILVVAFFVFYNTYLIDRSVVNLKYALRELSLAKTTDELQKIRPFLREILINEVSKKTTSVDALVRLEAALNILDNIKSMGQVADIKFYLQGLLGAQGKSRGAFLSSLDTLNSRFVSPTKGEPKVTLEDRANNLRAKIRSTKDNNLLQGYYYELGNIYASTEDVRQAESAFLQAIEAQPGTPLASRAKFNLAWVYKQAKEFKRAMVYFKEVAEENVSADLPLASQFQVADTLFKQGEFKAAAEMYSRLSDEFPELSVADLALYEAGCIAYYQLDDQKAAIYFLSKLEEKFPKAKIIQHEMEVLRPVMANNFLQDGYALLREKKYVEALDNFNKGVEVSPSSGPMLSGLALAYYWLNFKSMAVDNAKRAIQASPLNELVAVNVLFILDNSGPNEQDEAIRIGNAIMAQKEVSRADFYYNLAYAYILKAKIKEAQNSLTRTVRINPDFAYAYNNLGCAYWAVRNYAEAIRRFKVAVALKPDYLDAHFNLGVSHYYTNQFREAYDEFALIADINPNYKDIQDYIKRVQQAMIFERSAR